MNKIARVTLMSLIVSAVAAPALAVQQMETGRDRASFYLQASAKKQKKKKIAGDKKQKRKVASVSKKKKSKKTKKHSSHHSNS